MFHFTVVPTEIQEKQKAKHFPIYVKVLYNDPDPILKDYEPSACFVPDRFGGFAKELKEFPVRSDDLFVWSFMKTGTTLMSELVSVLLSGLQFEKIENESLWFRCPFLEISAMIDLAAPNSMELANNIPTTSRRLIKTHLPYNLMPQGVLKGDTNKIIYTVRNPKDAAISYFHHTKNMHGYQGTLADLLDGYLKGEVFYGSYFQHVDEVLRLSKIKDILVVKYEDMLMDMPAVVKKVAHYLGIRINEADIEKVCEFVHFDRMKMRRNSNFQDMIDALCEPREDGQPIRFLRKGKKDSYKEEMPPEYIERFDREMKKWNWIQEMYPEEKC